MTCCGVSATGMTLEYHFEVKLACPEFALSANACRHTSTCWIAIGNVQDDYGSSVSGGADRKLTASDFALFAGSDN